jgi:hypothetical protein
LLHGCTTSPCCAVATPTTNELANSSLRKVTRPTTSQA